MTDELNDGRGKIIRVDEILAMMTEQRELYEPPSHRGTAEEELIYRLARAGLELYGIVVGIIVGEADDD